MVVFIGRALPWLFLGASILLTVPAARAALSRSPKKAKANISKSAKLPTLLLDVEKKYAQAATLAAEFTQLNYVAALERKKESSGRILIKRPGKVRWETLRPDANILVSDGRKFWFYTPPYDETERGQVAERKASEVQTQLAQALLSGAFSAARDMSIEAVGTNEFTLTPKPGTAGTVQKAKVLVDPKKLTVARVTLLHAGGNWSEITLKNIELGKSLGDELFFFTPPPGTDQVE